MAFRELQAMQGAYELLSPLDPSAQQRAMAWLSAALADTTSAPTAAVEPAATVTSAAAALAGIEPVDGVAEAAVPHAAVAPAGETGAPEVSVVEPVLAAEPEPVTEPVADRRPRRRRPVKATGHSPRTATTSAPTATLQETAPGRRGERPSGKQFLADLGAVGSFKALAEKYGKSIGTIGNWANQLREQGFDIPVGRQRKD